jgi:hypothetical protein
MKLLLDNQKIAEEFFENTRLLGIMTPLKDYRFCWILNQQLGMDFRVNHEIEIQLTRKKRNYFFRVYEYAESLSALQHYIYNNQYEGEYLLPEFRHFDFIWLMKGVEAPQGLLMQKTDRLRQLEVVQMVAELTPDMIRHKEHLVF